MYCRNFTVIFFFPRQKTRTELYWTELVIFTQWKHFSDLVYTCELCEGNYESLKELCIHQSSCKKRFIRNNNVFTTPIADGYENVSDAQIEIADILLADEFVIDRIPEVVPNLPSYLESTKPRFSYHDIPGETFANLINDLCNEIVTWKNLEPGLYLRIMWRQLWISQRTVYSSIIM